MHSLTSLFWHQTFLFRIPLPHVCEQFPQVPTCQWLHPRWSSHGRTVAGFGEKLHSWSDPTLQNTSRVCTDLPHAISHSPQGCTSQVDCCALKSFCTVWDGANAGRSYTAEQPWGRSQISRHCGLGHELGLRQLQSQRGGSQTLRQGTKLPQSNLHAARAHFVTHLGFVHPLSCE